MRTGFRRAAVTAILCLSTGIGLAGQNAPSPPREPATASVPPSAETSRNTESYAVYSALISTSNSPVHLIAKSIVTSAENFGASRLDRNSRLDQCSKPSYVSEADWSEILEDFNRRGGMGAELAPNFKLDRPFELVTPEEFRLFQRKSATGPGAPRPVPLPTSEISARLIEPFEKASNAVRLSGVFFNRSGATAISLIIIASSGRVEEGMWAVLQKSDSGAWVASRPPGVPKTATRNGPFGICGWRSAP